MSQRKFPDDSSGLVHGPDGPVRRTRTHVLAGFTEPAPKTTHMGRNQAYIDEEGAWLNAMFLE